MRSFTIFRLILLLALIAAFLPPAPATPTSAGKNILKAARAYFEKGKFEEAAIEFRNAIGVDPAFAAAHYQLGLAYLEMQQWSRANQELARTVELQPANYPARV